MSSHGEKRKRTWLERLQAHLRTLTRGPIPQSPEECHPRQPDPHARHSLPSTTGRGGARLPLAAKSASLSSIVPERAPALDDFSDPSLRSQSWHISLRGDFMPGHETEQCSMCKTIGMEVPCRCMPVALPLLSGSKAWQILGRRYKAADAAPATDEPAQLRASHLQPSSLPQLRTTSPLQHPILSARAKSRGSDTYRDPSRSRALATSRPTRTAFV
ncbi:hypothetical protein T484DRAFT_1805061 [Baffinella frigidus]|nr:hypothetical protein T484DRAFT_1805061 [Cryptophyta sp. CCMP2293]